MCWLCLVWNFPLNLASTYYYHLWLREYFEKYFELAGLENQTPGNDLCASKFRKNVPAAALFKSFRKSTHLPPKI